MSLLQSAIIGLVLGLIAACVAFVIVYEAFQRQQFPRHRVFREAITAAAFAFAVFWLATIVVGYFLRRILA